MTAHSERALAHAISGLRPVVGRQALLWLSLAIVVAVSALSYRSLDALLESAGRVEHTQAVIYNLEQLVSLLRDGESGQRGFLLTGKDSYLEPYDRAAGALSATVARIRALVADNPRQLERLDRLEGLIAQRLDSLARRIEERRASGPAMLEEAPLDLDRGKALMDEIRAGVAQMSADEHLLLDARTATTRETASWTTTAILVGSAVSVSIIAAIFHLMQVEARRRRRTEGELQTLNAELDSRVRVQTVKLAETNERLAQSVDQLSTVIRSASAGLVALDPAGRVTMWNPAAERMFGFSAEEAIGKLMPYVPSDQLIESLRLLARVMAGETVAAAERQLQRKDGVAIDVNAWASPLRDGSGAVRGTLEIYENLSDRKALERQLHQAQKMEAVGQLTGGVAHDFNNLLTVIIGNLGLAEESAGPDSRLLHEIRMAGHAADRAAELTGRLLAFSRQQVLEPKSIDLDAIVSDLGDLLRRTLGEDIDIETVPAAELWHAVADPAKVENALLNLAINARDAMPDGGKLTIETANEHLDADYAACNPEVAPGDYAVLAVTDTGSGMPPDVLERAIEPFFTTKQRGKGSGLGLSTIYGFAKQSGGHLKIYSEAGHGTTVRLYLPRATVGDRASVQGEAGAVERSHDDESILVVEDDAQVRALAVMLLDSLGYRVQEARDAPTAKARLDGPEPFDLLFTDVVMPGGLTGRQLAEWARERRPGIKVLFTTGYTRNSIVHQGKLDPGVQLLPKPYKKDDLARKLREVLDATA